MISDQPERTLPHRAPFIWVTRLLERNEDGTEGVVELDVDPKLDLFRGHFPGNPIFPGVIQMEAAAQSVLWIHLGVLPEGATLPEVRFVGVESYKFRRPVIPPATIRIKARQITNRSRLHFWEIRLYVGEDVVSEGKFWLQMTRPPTVLSEGADAQTGAAR